MANKPTPKFELRIKLFGDRILEIVHVTADAKLWIEENATEFGNLMPDALGKLHESTLFVYEYYDAQEVMDYLNAEFNK